MKMELTCDETVRSDGSRSRSLPNRVGWFGYCVRQYSSKAHCDFSCSDSMWDMSDKPHASENERNKKNEENLLVLNKRFGGVLLKYLFFCFECFKFQHFSHYLLSYYSRREKIDVISKNSPIKMIISPHSLHVSHTHTFLRKCDGLLLKRNCSLIDYIRLKRLFTQLQHDCRCDVIIVCIKTINREEEKNNRWLVCWLFSI